MKMEMQVNYRRKGILMVLSILGAWSQLGAETQADLRVSKPLTATLGVVANLPWARIGVDYAVNRYLLVGAAHDFGPDQGTIEKRGFFLDGGVGSDRIVSSGYIHRSIAHLQVFPFESIPVYGTVFLGVGNGLHAEIQSVGLHPYAGRTVSDLALGTMDMKSDRLWGLGLGYRYLTNKDVVLGAELGLSRDSVRMNVNTTYASWWGPSIDTIISNRIYEDKIRRETVDDGTMYLPTLVFYCGVSL